MPRPKYSLTSSEPLSKTRKYMHIVTCKLSPTAWIGMNIRSITNTHQHLRIRAETVGGIDTHITKYRFHFLLLSVLGGRSKSSNLLQFAIYSLY